MSVAHLDTRELATFVAIASARCKAGTISELAEIAAMMSRSNSAAYTSQYGDHAEPAEAAEIEAEALRLLAADDLTAHFGPIVYNCVTNGGTLYFGDLPADATQTDIGQEVAIWRKIEAEASKWQDSQSRKLKRAEENAVAFNDVGRLPMKSAEELKALMGDGALIVAEFRVSECDSQSDYWGNRTSRHVVIGVRKGKRESFPSLRKAAGEFPPTADYGPGKSCWHVVALRNAATVKEWEQQYEPLRDETYRTMEFTTKPKAELFVADLIAKHPECQPGYIGVVGFPFWAKANGVEYREEPIEHRENYSMGGGNYLGNSRYGGWVVRSATYVNEPMEYFGK